MTHFYYVGGQDAAEVSDRDAVLIDRPVPGDDIYAAEARHFSRPGASDTFNELLAIAARLGLVARPVGAGDKIAQGGVISLVISGSVGLLVEGSGLLATILEAGEVIGVETLAGVPPRFRGVWLSPGVVMEMPADRWEAAASPHQARWIGETSGRLQHALAREISCCLEHPARTRLADLLCAMSQHGRLTKVIVTQAQLAQLLGLQRTSVCAAMDGLKTRKIAKAIRGRVEIRDFAGLTRAGCGCLSRSVGWGDGVEDISPALVRRGAEPAIVRLTPELFGQGLGDRLT